MNRQEQISNGKLWCVYPDGSDDNLFEGTKSRCLKYIRDLKLTRQVKIGKIRLGQIIWEKE